MSDLDKTKSQLIVETKQLRARVAELEAQVGETGGGDAMNAGVEQQYHVLGDTLGEGLAILDSAGSFTYANDCLGEMLDCQRGDLIGERLLHLSPSTQPNGQPSVEQFKEQARAALEAGRAVFEWQFRRHDGVHVDAEISLTPMVMAGEQRLVAVVRDVSAYKQVQRALAQEKETFLSVVQHAPYGIALLDGERLVYLNPAATKILGYTLREIPTVEKVFLHLYPDPEYRETMRQEWMRTVVPGAGDIGQEASVCCKDGRTKEIEFRSSRLGSGRTIVMMSDITPRKRVEEALRHMSVVDDLTSLYNRRGFVTLAEQQLKLAQRAHRALSLFFIDLDNMKWINDTRGHLEGDQALVEAAAIIKEAFRESDLAARLGGDEFVVLAIDATEESIAQLNARLDERLAAHNRRADRPYELSLSIGVAHYDGVTPRTLDDLLAEADRAMYESKSRKREAAAAK